MIQAALTIDEAARREETARLGLWAFLATVAMLFAAFTSAYIVRSSGSDWRPVRLPAALWATSAILIASSGAVEAARAWGGRDLWARAGAAMAAAVALGALFLAGQAAAWRTLIATGVYLPSSPHSSFFFMMTGAHALHVAAALCVLVWGGVKTWRGEGRRDPRAWRMTMSACRTFWHFLLLVWLYVFGVITLL